MGLATILDPTEARQLRDESPPKPQPSAVGSTSRNLTELIPEIRCITRPPRIGLVATSLGLDPKQSKGTQPEHIEPHPGAGATQSSAGGSFEFVRLCNEATPPRRGTKGSVGHDLYATKEVTLKPHESFTMIPTGIAIKMPPNTLGLIAPRSGLAAKHGVQVGAGIIDPDYEGELQVLLRTVSDDAVTIPMQKAIAQLIFIPVQVPEDVCPLDEKGSQLWERHRGTKGFGSTDQSSGSELHPGGSASSPKDPQNNQAQMGAVATSIGWPLTILERSNLHGRLLVSASHYYGTSAEEESVLADYAEFGLSSPEEWQDGAPTSYLKGDLTGVMGLDHTDSMKSGKRLSAKEARGEAASLARTILNRRLKGHPIKDQEVLDVLRRWRFRKTPIGLI